MISPRFLLTAVLVWFFFGFPWQIKAAQFTLTWADNSNNEDGFRVERSLDGVAFVEIATLPANVVSYVDAGLPNATTFHYRLRAFNTAGNSGYSNTAVGTTPPPPAPVPNAPGGLGVVSTGRLTNISTRAGLVADGSPVIGGFVVADGSVRVLIRGIGPALKAFGVADACPDTRVDLIGGASNDNWGEGSADDVALISSASAVVGAFPLAAGSKDAAMVVTLPPGTYTVHVNGVGGAAGQVLLEVYAVP